jgi:hypothetical protein
MFFNKKLNDFQEWCFNLVIIVTYLSIVASILGLSTLAPKYIDDLDYYVRIYICLFLLWRFNPFRKITKFTELDRKIVFSAGLFILTTSALNEYLIRAKDTIKQIFI